MAVKDISSDDAFQKLVNAQEQHSSKLLLSLELIDKLLFDLANDITRQVHNYTCFIIMHRNGIHLE